MNNFRELLKNDSEEMHEYADEKLVTTLRCTSLSYSLREEPNSEKFKKNNQWLFEENDKAGNIAVINFDRIPDMCNCSGVNTCDALFYDFNGNSKSYLIEFKNCKKEILQSKYLNIKSDDCILKKITDSKSLICSEINFEGKYNSADLVANTHVVIVYNGKNNMPARKIPLVGISRSFCKQGRPASINPKKSDAEITDKIGNEINKAGFSICYKGDFPVPGAPDCKNIKGIGKVRKYTLFSDSDFRELIEKEFFSNWDWGDYSAFFSV